MHIQMDMARFQLILIEECFVACKKELHDGSLAYLPDQIKTSVMNSGFQVTNCTLPMNRRVAVNTL